MLVVKSLTRQLVATIDVRRVAKEDIVHGALWLRVQVMRVGVRRVSGVLANYEMWAGEL